MDFRKKFSPGNGKSLSQNLFCIKEIDQNDIYLKIRLLEIMISVNFLY